ncbi:MAG: glycosyltransferase [Flavobacteriales bacterium]
MEPSMKPAVVVVCGHGIMDPLVSTLMLDYVFRLQAEGAGYRILLVTEEPGRVEVPDELLGRLRSADITWFPMSYELGGRQFAQRAWNVLRLIEKSFWFVRGSRIKVVVGFLSMAGSYASVLRSLGFHRFVLVNYEPHSRYMVETGVWREGSAKTRVARYFERRQLLNADVVVAPATAAVDLVRRSGSKARIVLQGVTVDVVKNRRRPAEGDHIRQELGLVGKTVLVYVGKFNGLYYSEADHVRFMAASCAEDPRIHHLVITFPTNARILKQLGNTAGLDGRFTVKGPVAPEELPTFLSAADLGVIAIPPTLSQRFRSPVKSALYWAAGLPIVIAQGVSDDWWIAKERKIGIVVKDLAELDAVAFGAELSQLVGTAAGPTQGRCVQAAMELRDTGLMVSLLRQAISGEWDE